MKQLNRTSFARATMRLLLAVLGLAIGWGSASAQVTRDLPAGEARGTAGPIKSPSMHVGPMSHTMHEHLGDWELISKTQVSLNVQIPGVDLTGKTCHWWSTDAQTHQTINGIFIKENQHAYFDNQDPWPNYYRFIPGQMACGFCVLDSGSTDTFMVRMDSLGPCADPASISKFKDKIVIDYDNHQNQWTGSFTVHGEGMQLLSSPYQYASHSQTPIVLPVWSFPAWVILGRQCDGGHSDIQKVVIY